MPAKALGLLPVLPADRGLTTLMVHTREIAEVIAEAPAAVRHQRAGGPFDPAAETSVPAAVLRPRTVFGALGSTIRHRPVEVRLCP